MAAILVALPPVLCPLPIVILNTPMASVLDLCTSINTFVPVVVFCIMVDCTYIFLSLAGLEKLSLATA